MTNNKRRLKDYCIVDDHANKIAIPKKLSTLSLFFESCLDLFLLPDQAPSIPSGAFLVIGQDAMNDEISIWRIEVNLKLYFSICNQVRGGPEKAFVAYSETKNENDMYIYMGNNSNGEESVALWNWPQGNLNQHNPYNLRTTEFIEDIMLKFNPTSPAQLILLSVRRQKIMHLNSSRNTFENIEDIPWEQVFIPATEPTPFSLTYLNIHDTLFAPPKYYVLCVNSCAITDTKTQDYPEEYSSLLNKKVLHFADKSFLTALKI